MGNLIQPIRSTTQILVVRRHQYGISALVSQTSFGGGKSGSVANFLRPCFIVVITFLTLAAAVSVVVGFSFTYPLETLFE